MVQNKATQLLVAEILALSQATRDVCIHSLPEGLSHVVELVKGAVPWQMSCKRRNVGSSLTWWPHPMIDGACNLIALI